MIRRSIAFFLLLLVTGQLTSKLIILTHFYLNRDEIAKTVCENRNKPEMKCNGKCHLNKQLKKDDDAQKPSPAVPTFKENSDWVYLSLENLEPIEVAYILLAANSFHFDEKFSSGYLSDIFHPPA